METVALTKETSVKFFLALPSLEQGRLFSLPTLFHYYSVLLQRKDQIEVVLSSYICLEDWF